MRIALFTTIPIKIMKPSIVSTLSGIYINKFSMKRPKNPPNEARGTLNIITRG